MLNWIVLIIFGSSLFGGEPMQVNPYQEAPAGYVLDKGDEVIIDIYGASQLQENEKLNVRGEVTIPNLGPICLSGKTIEGARTTLSKALASRFAESQVNVSLIRPRQIRVTIKGEVANPGEYLLHGYSNPLMALQTAGGITQYGSFRHIVVKGREDKRIDLYDYLLNGLNITAMRLHEEDEILVETTGCQVTIDGFVKRPATYELNLGQSLQDLIGYAGGLTEEDYEIRVTHRGAESLRIRTIAKDEVAKYMPKDGDHVSIISRADDPNHVVHVAGNVLHPNKYYSVQETMNTLHQLLQIAVPQANEKKNVVIVYRDTTLVQIGDQDMALQGREKVYVLPAVVYVEGAVTYETDVDYREGMTVKDYIAAAGGYTLKAQRSKVYTITPNGKKQKVSKATTIIPGTHIVVPKR